MGEQRLAVRLLVVRAAVRLLVALVAGQLLPVDRSVWVSRPRFRQ